MTCLIIERDKMTGATRRLDNMTSGHLGDTFTPEEAEATVQWRRKNIVSRYDYEIRPVITWVLDIATGEQYTLFMMALNTRFREKDPFDSPTVMVKPDGQPGGLVFAYTRKGTNSPPEWLVSLCAYFEAEGYEAGIRRPA